MSYRTKNEVRIAGLLAASIFGDLDHSRLVEIAQAAHEYRYEPGQLIFQPGDPCNQLSIIASGNVNVSFNSEDGKEVIVAELGVGDTIGETELLSNSRRLTNCVATRNWRSTSRPSKACCQMPPSPGGCWKPFAGACSSRCCSPRACQSTRWRPGLPACCSP
ncbi:MAG: cyclic nucleotide-binding domain-containing protein [Mesorhizobium sp.]|nr:MAG: cyclic nucleotide-binding domain-containing protein [Mesorhizobium sp.]